MIVLNAVLRFFSYTFFKVNTVLPFRERSVWDFAISTFIKSHGMKKIPWLLYENAHALECFFFLNCFRVNWQTQNRYQFLACLYNSILVLILLNSILLIYKIPWHFWSRCLFYDVIYIRGIFAHWKYNIWRKSTEPLLFYTDGIRYALICLEKN